MGEYIERESLKRSIFNGVWYDNQDEDVAYDLVDKAPAADVVEVVRCKDCKHYCLSDYRKPNEPRWCELSREQDEYPKPNDFCSYGEKMDGKGEGE